MEMAILSDISRLADLGVTVVIAVALIALVIWPLIKSVKSFSEEVNRQARETGRLADQIKRNTDHIREMSNEVITHVDIAKDEIIKKIKEHGSDI